MSNHEFAARNANEQFTFYADLASNQAVADGTFQSITFAVQLTNNSIYSVTELGTEDYGQITSGVTTTEDYAAITQSVTATEDYGSLTFAPEVEFLLAGYYKVFVDILLDGPGDVRFGDLISNVGSREGNITGVIEVTSNQAIPFEARGDGGMRNITAANTRLQIEYIGAA
jgi:hypothetical protein